MTQADSTATWNAAIQRLYAAFAGHRAPVTLGGSPFRDVAGIFHDLQAAPLRMLAPDKLSRYASSAITTVGGADDYRHFLPRIVELSLMDASRLGTEPAIIISKLDRAGWQSWPVEERVSVRGAFLASWAWSLDRPLWVGRPLDWLNGLAAIGDVDDALVLWRRSLPPHAQVHLADFIVSQKWLGHSEPVKSWFWPYAYSSAIDEIRSWVRDRDVRSWLGSATTENEEDRHWLWLAGEILDGNHPDEGSS